MPNPFDSPLRVEPIASAPADIRALQVLHKNTRDSDGDSYACGELNLVMYDCSRLHVVMHGNVKALLADARMLAQFLRVPLV